MQSFLQLLLMVKKPSHELDVIVAVEWYCDLLEACEAEAFRGYLKTA